MSDEPKFCKDCKHYFPTPPIGMWAMSQAQNALTNRFALAPSLPPADHFRDYCRHPSKRSLITGYAAEDPKMMRAGSCGPEGNLWEEKPPAPPIPDPICEQVNMIPELIRPPEVRRPWWRIWA